MIKAVIFDFDGTLADTEPFHSAKRAEMLDELGVTADNDFVGISLRTFWGGIVKSYNLNTGVEELAKRNLFEVAREVMASSSLRKRGLCLRWLLLRTEITSRRF